MKYFVNIQQIPELKEKPYVQGNINIRIPNSTNYMLIIFYFVSPVKQSYDNKYPFIIYFIY